MVCTATRRAALLVGVPLVMGLAPTAFADGSPRRVDLTSVQESSRAHSARVESRAATAPRSVARQAYPRALKRSHRTGVTETTFHPGSLRWRGSPSSAMRRHAPSGTATQPAVSEIEAVGAARAPDQLQDLLELRSETAVRAHMRNALPLRLHPLHAITEVQWQRAGFGLDHTATPLHLRNQFTRSHSFDHGLPHQVTEEHLPLDTTAIRTPGRMMAEETRAELDHHATPAGLRYTQLKSRTATDDLPRAAGAWATPQNVARADADYRLEEQITPGATGAVAARGETPVLTASARSSTTVGRSDTLVVLSVKNTAAQAVTSPVIRVVLPAGVRYEGLAFGPPGAAAAVTETAQGQTVEVVVPVTVPAGAATRAIIYVSPRQSIIADDVLVKAFPMGTTPAAAPAGTRASNSTQGLGASDTQHISKDP